ncbi:hypothetical protein P256_01744 [Acinetobacter nectaris CIP 110549]|uniref:Uncharacterized protein n=1 Tax=Acinetobacter nectaris CIP 110549 TaxID=1392540 RepID=V2T6V7_9GAMM|nr:hypothetical protein [Acinetobacter nectaris]ESK38213.1 hypothetical protein P256_01744 [Acinetobacter nectaris CIP 110549]
MKYKKILSFIFISLSINVPMHISYAHPLSNTESSLHKEQHDKFNDEIQRLKERKKELFKQQKTVDKMIHLKEIQLKQLEKELNIKKVA